MAWTEKDVETLTKLYNEGLSHAQIGAKMGRTREATLGKIHRLREKGDPRVTRLSTGASTAALEQTRPDRSVLDEADQILKDGTPALDPADAHDLFILQQADGTYGEPQGFSAIAAALRTTEAEVMDRYSDIYDALTASERC